MRIQTTHKIPDEGSINTYVEFLHFDDSTDLGGYIAGDLQSVSVARAIHLMKSDSIIKLFIAPSMSNGVDWGDASFFIYFNDLNITESEALL